MALDHKWIWTFLILSFVSTIYCKEARVVCYYTNWSVYRPGNAKFNPQNINPYLCTHLVYAFGGFTKENTLKPFDKYQDIEKGGYAKFTGLKTYNKQLKTMLAIGGWNEGSSRFSPMVASSERRKELVKNVIKFLRQNHFDGLDLDWEYPSFRDGGKARDRDNYASLVQELREEFERESEKTGKQRLLLTMAVPAGIEYINKGYDVPKLMKYLDWMNILSYDYHSAFEPSVNHHAPLYPLEEENEYSYDTDLNIDFTIKHYLKSGAIPEKLVLGIPTYGRSYTLFNPDANEIGAPADGPGEMGDATRENGYLAYYEICDNVLNNGWTVVNPNKDAMGPYAYKENQWVGYDDESIARKKAEYVVENGLGGIMFWAIDNDDFRGSCHNKSYPLIEAAKESLIKSLGLTDENAIHKPTRINKVRGQTLTKTKEVADTVQNSGGRQSIQSKRRRVNNNRNSKRRPKTTTTTGTVHFREDIGSSLVVTTPKYITPAPPTTPDPGGAEFKCEDEGFYPHPKDCKRYFWCLNGPSELGIIAHQFTCPSGLYFNKAASSCDYTQNVLCNKKISKAITKTTSKPTTKAIESTTTSSSTTESRAQRIAEKLFSTKRPPPKITAATSRTTFYATSTTSKSIEPDEEEDYEYEDDEDEQDVNDNTNSEDPKVIKELLELIKKAGGIEELEKQLNIKEGTRTSEPNENTTPLSISKKLYERVLARTKLSDTTTTRSVFKNSRGPQNAGILKTNDEKQAFRPKYSTITRERKVKNNDDELEEAEEEDVSNERNKQYITLNRNRATTKTKLDDEETEKENIPRSTRAPYISLRRSRPTTTTAIPELETEDRGNIGQIIDNQQSTVKYQTIQRNRPITTEQSVSRYKEIERTTLQQPSTTPETELRDVITETSAKPTRTRRPVSRFRQDFRRSTTTNSPKTISYTNRIRTNRRRPQTPATTTESGVTTTKPTRRTILRTDIRKHLLTTTLKPTIGRNVKDQKSESSNQGSNEKGIIHNETSTEITDLASALQKLQHAPIRPEKDYTKYTEILKQKQNIPNDYHPTQVPYIEYKHVTTNLPPSTTHSRFILTNPKPSSNYDRVLPVITTYTYKPITDYDYYDDGDAKYIGSIPKHSKVLIHSTGVIQCLDQGNFPHPVSCKKFISCAKMENGNVLGWEYTCPKNLSFDPIGGMCNWSLGLGCNE